MCAFLDARPFAYVPNRCGEFILLHVYLPSDAQPFFVPDCRRLLCRVRSSCMHDCRLTLDLSACLQCRVLSRVRSKTSCMCACHPTPNHSACLSAVQTLFFLHQYLPSDARLSYVPDCRAKFILSACVPAV
mmetsp:Transcript_39186/g.77076  ORF Transcript_39186/g.77076 Transcript_39186/m.77076 type:complete len:131 (-) Transcript_39186:358-750(-)